LAINQNQPPIAITKNRPLGGFVCRISEQSLRTGHLAFSFISQAYNHSESATLFVNQISIFSL